MRKQNLVNHIALVLDESLSMGGQKDTLIKVADELVSYLARRSDELAQETRISVFTFADRAKCVIWDMDVLRLPSIKDLYRPHGWTALIDAALLSLDDLAMTPEKYGDHSFLIYVLTDGYENASRNGTANDLKARIAALKDHWTIAALVPDNHGIEEAKKAGFPAGNIALWDATTTDGVLKVGTAVTQATDTYMVNRAFGVRSSKNLFTATSVNKADIQSAGLTPLDSSAYVLVPVIRKIEIKAFVESHGHRYVTSKGFYQLSKREEIQGNKKIMILEKATNKVFSGAEARRIIGLPDHNIRVSPNDNKDYLIFVQSQSHNRNLMPNTQLLYLV